METITFYILIFATLLTIIYVYFHYNNCIDHFVSVNGDEYVDINDIKTDNKIMVVLRNMLRDTNNILKLHNIQYWIDGGTLLGAVRHHDIIPWDDDADICILESDEHKFLELKPIFYSVGYDIANGGVDIKFTDK